MNPGGIRGGATFGFLVTPSGAEAPGEVTYGEAFTVQPFGNSLVTKTMTGAQIRLLLEQQFVGLRRTDDAAHPADLGRLQLGPATVPPRRAPTRYRGSR